MSVELHRADVTANERKLLPPHLRFALAVAAMDDDADPSTMEEFGLDPKRPDDRAYWAEWRGFNDDFDAEPPTDADMKNAHGPSPTWTAEYAEREKRINEDFARTAHTEARRFIAIVAALRPLNRARNRRRSQREPRARRVRVRSGSRGDPPDPDDDPDHVFSLEPRTARPFGVLSDGSSDLSERQHRLVWRSAALEPDCDLSWRARLAACVYCEYASGGGVLDPAPSASTVASGMGCAERTARAARQELESKCWLSIKRRPGRPSRIVLVTADRPRRVMPGSEAPTPARTPARTPAPAATEPENQRTSTNLPAGGSLRDPDEALRERAREYPATGQGTVAAIVDTLREFNVPELGEGELKIVGRHAAALHRKDGAPELIAIAGLAALLLRRAPELTQRLYGDLVAEQTGARITREEWDAAVHSSNGAAPFGAIAERRRVAALIEQEADAHRPQPPCPNCGTGGGRHRADCPAAQPQGGST